MSTVVAAAVSGAIASMSYNRKRSRNSETPIKKESKYIQAKNFANIFDAIEFSDNLGGLRKILAKDPRSVNSIGINGNTPLIHALRFNDKEMANFLIRKINKELHITL